jgi:hypothetical protein
VLTAAHCNGSDSPTTLVVGAYKVNNPDASSAQIRAIAEKVEHPDYNSGNDRWDFMLLRLDSPVTTLAPVQINSNKDVPGVNEGLTVIGVGATSEGGGSSNTLLEVVVKYVPTSECNLNSAYGGQVHDPSMFCAGKCVIIVSFLCRQDEVRSFVLHLHPFFLLSQLKEARAAPTLARVTREVPLSVRLTVSKYRLEWFPGEKDVPGPVSLVFILESVAPMIGSQKPRALSERVNIVEAEDQE